MNGVIVDDEFYCTIDQLAEFKAGRVWREMLSWIKARQVSVADKLIDASGEQAIRDIQVELRVLRDLAELPDLITETLMLKESNASTDETEENLNDAGNE